MKSSEIMAIIGAIIILTAVIGISFPFTTTVQGLLQAFMYSAIIILVYVFSKKIFAFMVDSDVEHELWKVSRYGPQSGAYLRNPAPAGIIVPLFFTVLSLGFFKIMPMLTYETRALSIRASKRFGYYSYTEMSEWHNGLIGAVGIISVLIVSLISYILLPANDILWRMAIYFAFWNMIPVSNLDGTQIFFGSRTLWSTLAIITAIATAYALLLI
jgi:hypothetical protein